jgi:nicotinamidase-related amidase
MTEPAQPVPAWPIPRPSFEFAPERTALVVVDMQEAQCDPTHGMGRLVAETPELGDYFFSRLETVVANQRRLLESFRARGGRVAFLTIGSHVPDGSDMVAWKRRRNAEMVARDGMDYAEESQPANGVIAALEPRPEEPVLHKATFGGFLGTGLDQLLRGWEVDQLLLCGLATNVCVYTTAIEAADRGYECAMVEDACAAWAPQLHQVFIENFGLLYGRTGSTEELLAELGERR